MRRWQGVLLAGALVAQVSCSSLPPAGSGAYSWGLPPGSPVPVAPGYAIEHVAIPQVDGNPTLGLWLHRPDAVATVLYFGDAESRTDRVNPALIAAMGALKLNLLLTDYRGSGATPSIPSMQLLLSDALGSFDWLRQRESGKIIVEGLSFGSFMAANVAHYRPADGLVLEATDTKPTEWQRVVIPWPGKVLVARDFSPEPDYRINVRAVKAFQGPLLIMAGSEDVKPSPEPSVQLFDAAASPAKELKILPGADRTTLEQNPEFIVAYRAFLQRVVGSARASHSVGAPG
jgi:pimeloyl-ACP methyl ester carboxylesterase